MGNIVVAFEIAALTSTLLATPFALSGEGGMLPLRRVVVLEPRNSFRSVMQTD